MENIFKDELIQRVEVAVENKAVTMQTVEAKKNTGRAYDVWQHCIKRAGIGF